MTLWPVLIVLMTENQNSSMVWTFRPYSTGHLVTVVEVVEVGNIGVDIQHRMMKTHHNSCCVNLLIL